MSNSRPKKYTTAELKVKINEIANNHYDEDRNIQSEDAEIYDVFCEFITAFENAKTQAEGAGGEALKEFEDTFTPTEYSWLANFYYNRGVIGIRLFVDKLEQAETVAKLQQQENKWRSSEVKSVYARTRTDYHLAKKLYAKVGDEADESKGVLRDDDALQADYDIARFCTYVSKLVELRNRNENLELQNYLFESLKKIVSACKRETPLIAKDGKYADSTWLMVTAENDAYVQGLISELVNAFPESVQASIQHDDRQSGDDLERYYGYNVSTLAARAGNVLFSRDVLTELKKLGRQDLVTAFVNAANQTGNYVHSTALMFACYFGHVDYVKLLLENNVDVFVKRPPFGLFHNYDALAFAFYGNSEGPNLKKENYFSIVLLLLQAIRNQKSLEEFKSYLKNCYSQAEIRNLKDFPKDNLSEEFKTLLSQVENILEDIQSSSSNRESPASISHVVSQPAVAAESVASSMEEKDEMVSPESLGVGQHGGLAVIPSAQQFVVASPSPQENIVPVVAAVQSSSVQQQPATSAALPDAEVKGEGDEVVSTASSKQTSKSKKRKSSAPSFAPSFLLISFLKMIHQKVASGTLQGIDGLIKQVLPNAKEHEEFVDIFEAINNLNAAGDFESIKILVGDAMEKYSPSTLKSTAGIYQGLGMNSVTNPNAISGMQPPAAAQSIYYSPQTTPTSVMYTPVTPPIGMHQFSFASSSSMFNPGNGIIVPQNSIVDPRVDSRLAHRVLNPQPDEATLERWRLEGAAKRQKNEGKQNSNETRNSFTNS